MRTRLLAIVLLLAAPWFAARADDVTIRDDDVVLVRHATAPGIGDPANIRLDDCSTQRNLDDKGRAEARRLGEEFRRRHVKIGAVLTSQWCRTRETARLAFPQGKVRDEPAFNSWFGQVPVESESQLAQARDILKKWNGPGVLVVVTHAVNINALVGVSTAPAEAVVVRKGAGGELKVIGSVRP